MPVKEIHSSYDSSALWGKTFTDLKPNIIAVLVGVALFFTLPFIISALFGDNTRWYLTLLVAPYAIAGIVLGIVLATDGLADWHLVICRVATSAVIRSLLDSRGSLRLEERLTKLGRIFVDTYRCLHWRMARLITRGDVSELHPFTAIRHYGVLNLRWRVWIMVS